MINVESLTSTNFDQFLTHNSRTTVLPNSLNFISNDTQDVYNDNLKTRSSDWIYRSKNITYDLNSDGYRCVEFDHIDWKESIVIFGCSIVFGVGLAFEDTIGEQLSRIMNRPVINLGQPATSVSYAFYNSIILKERCKNPWAVIQLWSAFNRSLVVKNNSLEHIGPWNYKNSDLHNDKISNDAFHFSYITKASKFLWDDTRYVSASFFQYDTNTEPLKLIDHARDLCHPGIVTAKTTAEIIAEKIIRP